MSVVIRDFEVVPQPPAVAPEAKAEDEKPGSKPQAKSPEMGKAVEKHLRRMQERHCRVRAY